VSHRIAVGPSPLLICLEQGESHSGTGAASSRCSRRRGDSASNGAIQIDQCLPSGGLGQAHSRLEAIMLDLERVKRIEVRVTVNVEWTLFISLLWKLLS